MKMEKIQQTVLVNERDYKNFVAVLKETTTSVSLPWRTPHHHSLTPPFHRQWNQQWRAYCDVSLLPGETDRLLIP